MNYSVILIHNCIWTTGFILVYIIKQKYMFQIFILCSIKKNAQLVGVVEDTCCSTSSCGATCLMMCFNSFKFKNTDKQYVSVCRRLIG